MTDKQNGNLAFKIHSFVHENPFAALQHNNYYTILIITRGSASLNSSFSTIPFSAKGIACFSPYQPFMIKDMRDLKGTAIHFHPDFFCIYRHHNEVASNGALFNNAYQSPYFSIKDEECDEIIGTVLKMKTEMINEAIAQQELLILHLKIILINAIRIKNREQDHMREMLSRNRNAARVQHLVDAIEEHYHEQLTVSEYSSLLGMPAKSVARLAKKYLDKTLTDLIGERIMIEAKRELYLTSKPIKAIAYTLGFTDEYYFSRFFKKRADISPQFYRDKVGSGREALLL
ncbi:MAG: helix-turn-helix domain-containing protein [Bacteroidota bacterium]